jgi:predicted PurR-regulated permease PerM
MQIDRRFYKTAVAALVTVVLFAWVLNNLRFVAQALGWIYGILYPFLLGGAIAFILNVPMKKIEGLLFGWRKKHGKAERPVAIALTVLCLLVIIAIAVLVIIPGITDAVNSIIRIIPNAFTTLREYINLLPFRIPALDEFLGKTELDWATLAPKLADLMQTQWSALVSSGANAIGDIISAISSFFIGAMFSIYLLSQKEKLARQLKQSFYALLPEGAADKTLEVLSLSRETFSDFITGQTLGAFILSIIFFAFMSVFRMPYAVMISVVIFITAFIPIIGPIIACITGGLLILLVNPLQSLIFLILFLVLQQIMASLIYPRVVGNAIGLPSIWVLGAVILGGELLGIIGVLLFIPLCSVLYSLFRTFVQDRLQNRRITNDKWSKPLK